MSSTRPVWAVALCGLLAAWGSTASAEDLELVDAVREALDSNLDLAARRRALAAEGENVELAKARLLPQFTVAARAQRLDDDRTDSERGETTSDSLTLAGKATMLLYDEQELADVTIEKHVYAGRAEQLEAFRLGVIEDAGSAFLELDRARADVDMQERNRALTVHNRKTSRARIAAGWSSDREVLRWDSQLAANDRAVTDAQTQVLLSRFQLNRVRNRSAEAALDPQPVDLEKYGFVYARQTIVDSLATPEGERRLRDYLVGIGLARSPDLAALDDAIVAAERQLVANRRGLWAPSLGIDATINHVAADGSGGAADFDETEWTLGAAAVFPLYLGGAKFAELRQTREALSALRIERRSAAQTVDQVVRSAFAEASGSFASLGFARRQEAAAARSFELTNESYVLGVASILALLDAQSQLLLAKQAVIDAFYEFFDNLLAAEREIALYPFLEPEPEVRALLDDYERQIPPTP